MHALTTLGLAACFGGAPVERGPPPSVLLVTLEDAPAARFAPWGGSDPRLDDLAARGTTWTRAYAPSPQLQPNLATVLTGLDVARHGVRLDGAYALDEAHTTWLERLRDAGWTTATSTGTQRTDDRWGLHQGSDHARVLDDRERVALTIEEITSGLALGGERQAAWVHVDARQLDGLLEWLPRWVEAHPETLLVVVGVEGASDGISLVDDALRLPLVAVGPGFAPGVVSHDVVGLTDIAPTLLLAADLDADGAPLQSGGSGVVLHRSHAGRSALGLAVLEGRTTRDGRFVAGAFGVWHGALGDRIPDAGHVVPATHPAARAHDTAQREARRGAAPRRLLTAYELHRLAREAPLVLGDPEGPQGTVDPREAADRIARLPAAVMALGQSRFAEVDRLLAGDPLQYTPAGRLIAARAARNRAHFHDAAAELELAHGSWPGALWATQRAELAVDQCRADEAVSWVQAASERAPDTPGLMAVLARAATIEAPSPALTAAAEHLLSLHPNDPLAGALRSALDPVGIDLLPRPWSPVAEAARARSLWAEGRAEEALDVQRHAVRLDPFACPARLTLARWTAEAGQREEALRLLAPLVRRDPIPAVEDLWSQVQLTETDRLNRRIDRIYER